MNRSAFADYSAGLREQSWLIGDSWSHIRLSCIAWDIKPKWRFPGPFVSETAKSMLILGNTVDPVTPLRNAHVMAKRFPGSRILATEGEGHCMLSAPSLCGAGYIRDYFQTGQMPLEGTVCETNEKAFEGVTDPGDGMGESCLRC